MICSGRFFVLVLLLWTLLVLYPNPGHLVTSLIRFLHPNLCINPIPVESLADESPSDPELVEKEVLKMIPYHYDWEVYGMPWYFPTIKEVLQRGEGDCKARAVMLASLLEAKGISCHLSCSPTHIWVEYKGKKQNSLENTAVQFYQIDPQTGQKSYKFPHIPLSEVARSSREALWNPMPLRRKAFLVFGLVGLITARLTLSCFKKCKPTSNL